MPNYTADSVLNQTFDATNTALNANLVASTAYIAPTTHVTASDIGAVNDTYVTQGAEIDARGMTTLGIWVDMTVNDSTGNQIQILGRHTSGGDGFILETSTAYQKTLGNASINVFYEFETSGLMPYVVIQSKATVVGATPATLTIRISKSAQ